MENRFFNRELSWLEFNARVLFQALRKELPLLERLQFLSIVTSNFDEFFQVRVASVKRLLAEDPSSVDISGLTSQLVLTSISATAHQIIRTQHNCLMNDILPKLAEKGYVYVSPQDYSPQQTEFLQGVFKNEIFKNGVKNHIADYTAYNSAYGTLICFFRAYIGAHFVFSQKASGKICKGIGKPCGKHCKKN